MKVFTTTIMAICPIDGELKRYAGQNVPGISFATAQEYCNQNGMGYCKVDGILVEEIPCKSNGNPDWNGCINYENDLN
jgi:hypothetical protein